MQNEKGLTRGPQVTMTSINAYYGFFGFNLYRSKFTLYF